MTKQTGPGVFFLSGSPAPANAEAKPWRDAYADALAWLEAKDGVRLVTELEGRKAVVVAVAGRSAHAIMGWTSEVAERAAFVSAVRELEGRL